MAASIRQTDRHEGGQVWPKLQNPRARASRVALSPRARLQSPLIAPAPHNPRGPCPCPGTADTDTREALPWVSQLAAARHTRATCYVLTSATKQPAAARAGGGPGEPLHPAWILPVLPRRVAPLLRCLTQSRGDETPAPQPRRWPAPWGADTQHARACWAVACGPPTPLTAAWGVWASLG